MKHVKLFEQYLDSTTSTPETLSLKDFLRMTNKDLGGRTRPYLVVPESVDIDPSIQMVTRGEFNEMLLRGIKVGEKPTVGVYTGYKNIAPMLSDRFNIVCIEDGWEGYTPALIDRISLYEIVD